jgi:hypothetical protein
MIAFAFLIAAPLCAASTTFYVSCSDGDDHHAGTLAAPFRTLERARDAVRSATNSPPSAIYIRAGVCELSVPLELTSLDSNVMWSAYQDESVLLSGGVQLKPNSIMFGERGVMNVDLYKHNITDFGTLKGRGYAGGSGCIELNNFEPSALELFFHSSGEGTTESRMMSLARYPNLQFPVAKANWEQVKSVKGSVLGVSSAMAQRISSNKWAAEPEVWTHGLWNWNWADSHRPVSSVGSSTLTVGADDIGRDVDLKAGGNFYAYNILSELDAAGEYYLDRKTGLLSFLPPAAASGAGNGTIYPAGTTCDFRVEVGRNDKPGQVFEVLNITARWDDTFKFDGCSTSSKEGQRCVHDLKVAHGVRDLVDTTGAVVGAGVCCNDVRNSVISTTRAACSARPLPPPTPPPTSSTSYFVSMASSVITIKGASSVTFAGLHIKHARGAGSTVSDCKDVSFTNCTIADNGMMAVNVTGGSGCSVVDSEVSGNGDAGVVLMGGDRTTLTPAKHHVSRSKLHRNQRWIMNYAPNVFLGGVGNGVYDSELADSPQICVFMQGNDHVLNGSSVHHCAEQCSDCGAFYMVSVGSKCNSWPIRSQINTITN